MIGELPAYAGFLALAVPAAAVAILLAKTSRRWRRALAACPAWGRALVALAVAALTIFGGGKPGPTFSNLRLLLAGRDGKLSTGTAYGPRSGLVAAMAATDGASNAVAAARASLPVVEGILVSAEAAVAAATAQRRDYLRLRFPRPALTETNNLYGEIHGVSATNGVASALVWFSVQPNVEPQMRFTFAMRSATNRLATVVPTGSSWPDLVSCGGYDCVRYDFPVPPALLDGDRLRAPLDHEARVAFGSPETDEPFDVRGGVALYRNGTYYVAVTGWRTNAVTGVAHYFADGRLANPPELATNEDPPL